MFPKQTKAMYAKRKKAKAAREEAWNRQCMVELRAQYQTRSLEERLAGEIDDIKAMLHRVAMAGPEKHTGTGVG